MGRGRTVRRALGALLVVAALDASPARADLFCNAAAITINDAAVATPYPSTINVSGMTGGVTQLRVRILGLSHTFPDDIQLLLVGPGGQKMTPMTNAGGNSGISGVNLILDDAAAGYVPDAAVISSGTFRPSSYGNVAPFPAPAPSTSPASPYAKTFAPFAGTDPNGTWTLYVWDPVAPDSGTIAGGWCVDVTTAPAVATCPSALFTGSIASGDPTQTGRLVRDGVTSLCTTAKPYPGTNDTALGRRFDQYAIVNQNTATQCITASLTSGCGGNLFLVAYSGSYVPTDVQTNYLADDGQTSINTSSLMGFQIAPGATVVLAVHETTAGAGCASYGLLVEGNLCVPSSPSTTTSIPGGGSSTSTSLAPGATTSTTNTLPPGVTSSTSTSTTSSTTVTLGPGAVGHLECYKAKDQRPKASYTLGLSGNVPGFTGETACKLKLGAKRICVEVDKQNVLPRPPGGGPLVPPNTGSVFLSYKVRCPRQAIAPVTLVDQFGGGSFGVAKATELLVPALPGGANDHFECYKAKDARPKATYTADLAAGVAGFMNQLGCTVKVPAKRLCVQVSTANVTPAPPGGGPGPGPSGGQRFLYYDVSCPKWILPPASIADPFGTGTLTPGVAKSLLVPAS